MLGIMIMNYDFTHCKCWIHNVLRSAKEGANGMPFIPLDSFWALLELAAIIQGD
jgi:hypothetical protein